MGKIRLLPNKKNDELKRFIMALGDYRNLLIECKGRFVGTAIIKNH